QKPVAGRLYLTAGEPRQLPANQVVVTVEDVSPSTVAQRRRRCSRVDDVGEQDGGEHPVRGVRRRRAGEELLHAVEQLIGVSRPPQVVVALELDVPGARYPIGEVTAERGVYVAVAAPVVHDRRRGDRTG